jgi:hypothetical protein
MATLEEWPGELVVSAFTATEADHLVLSRLGVDAELAIGGAGCWTPFSSTTR